MFDRRKNSKQGSPKAQEPVVRQDAPTLGGMSASPGAKSAIIGQGIEIAGDVTANTDLVVNGRVRGSIVQSSHSVEVGETGQVNARIRAALVKVSGEVKGDIMGDEKVLLTRTGRVLGNIIAPRVQLDDGAIFKGSIDMTPLEAAKPASPAPAKKEPTASSPAASSSKDVKPGNSVTASSPQSDSGRKEPSLTLKSG